MTLLVFLDGKLPPFSRILVCDLKLYFSSSIASPHSEAALKTGEWVSVYADKDGHGSIQNKLMYKDGSTFQKETEFKTCDGITNNSKCDWNTSYKAGCNQHYVFYPDEYPYLICKAKTDDNGDLVHDENGEPYGDCGDCKNGDELWRGRNLRGGDSQLEMN